MLNDREVETTVDSFSRKEVCKFEGPHKEINIQYPNWSHIMKYPPLQQTTSK